MVPMYLGSPTFHQSTSISTRAGSSTYSEAALASARSRLCRPRLRSVTPSATRPACGPAKSHSGRTGC
jgi:hypothetical protein